MNNDNYTDVDEFTPNWNPFYTGSKEEGNKTQLSPSDDSWIEGFYIGSREQKIKNDTYVIHKVKAIAAGNLDHLGAELQEGGTEYEFFGSGVLNAKISEKVQPGMCIKIKWLGVQESKKTPGRKYHGWKVFINNSVAPISIQNGVIISDANTSNNEFQQAAKEDVNVAAVAQNQATIEDEGDDDLPF